MLGCIKIIRPLNSAVSGLAAVIACIIAGVNDVYSAVLIFFIVALICGAGNVINDFFDYEIDKINRPNRPIPSGAVSKRGALIETAILFTAGVILSVFTGNIICFTIAVVNSLLLIVYAAKLKGLPFLGNLAVAYLSGSIFLFGAAVSYEFMLVLPLFAVTFFGTLAREILKDAEDIEGDSVFNLKTLPIIIGVRKSEVLAAVFIFSAVIFSLIPYFEWGLIYLILILPADAFMIFVTVRAVKFKTAYELKNSRTSGMLKIGMFAALAVFFVMSVV